MTEHAQHLGRGGLTDQVDVEGLLEQLGLDDEEIRWRKDFVDFDEADARRLADFEDDFVAHADEVADAFYDNLTDYEETRAVIERSSKSIDQLERTQKAYLTTLAGGEYDRGYFADRARIGKLHELLDMPMKQYIGQYDVYYDLLLDLVGDRIRDRLAATVETAHGQDTAVGTAQLTQRLSSDVEAGLDELHSLLKLLNLDMQVAVDTYIQSHLDDVAAQRDRFAALFENVPAPVVVVRITDDTLRVEQVNAAFEELFGYTTDDLSGRNFEEYLSPPETEPRPIEDRRIVDNIRTGSESELSEAEVTLETQFGRRDFIRVSAPVDRDGAGDLEYAFYIDVTDQKQRQERLQVLSRVLRHDIRNKLNVVTGCASASRESVDDDDVVEMLNLVERSATSLLSTSRQIRQVERLVAGEADRKAVDLGAVVDGVLETARERYPSCSFTLSAGDPVRVTGVEALAIAVEEVVENAAQHNDAAAPRVEVSVTESLDDQYGLLRVADNGPGIPPEEYEVLTGKRERSQITHPSGLGLWTVNWIVTRAGGSVHFDANSPRGSIVTIRLPRESVNTET